MDEIFKAVQDIRRYKQSLARISVHSMGDKAALQGTITGARDILGLSYEEIGEWFGHRASYVEAWAKGEMTPYPGLYAPLYRKLCEEADKRLDACAERIEPRPGIPDMRLQLIAQTKAITPNFRPG